MMHRLRRYDVFRFAQNDVAPFGRNDVMFAPMCPQAHIIRVANIIRRSRHHLPQANIIQKTHLCLGRQKCVFCWLRRWDLKGPPPSHSRAVSLGTLASCAPCFGRFRLMKTILNRFHLRYPRPPPSVV